MDSKAVDDKSRVKMLSVNSDRVDEGDVISDGTGIITLIWASHTRVTSFFKWRRSILAPMSDNNQS